MTAPIPHLGRRLLLLTAGGAILAALPVGFGQAPGAPVFAPPMAMAGDDDRREDRRDDADDARDDRQDRRDDDRDDDRDDSRDDSRDDRPDDSEDDRDDDRSDDRDDDRADDRDDRDDDRDDRPDDSDDREDRDDSRDDRPSIRPDDSRQPASTRIRNITVTYPDGWIERIVNGQYELIDNLNRRVILRPATQDDFARMMALG